MKKLPAAKATLRGAPALVIPFPPRWERGDAPSDGRPRCARCGSAWVDLEPAFLHCRYCGTMTRIPAGSLADQELFELRSGLRLAS
jgi:hypothetical protein